MICSCSNVSLLGFLTTARKIIWLIQLIVPILLIISSAFQFVKLVRNPDEKNGIKKLINSFLAAIIVFMVPVLLNFVMELMGDSNMFSSCYKEAGDSMNISSSYSDPYSNNSRKNSIPNSSDYEKGNKKTKKTNGKKGSSSVNHSRGKTVFIGDSRTVQMYAYLVDNWNGANYSSGGIHETPSDVFIAEGAMGFDWLKSTGIPAANSYIQSGSTIVIYMGVNDTFNASQYIQYINSNIDNWTSNGSVFYYVSVTPCNGSYSSHNSKIEKFNSQLKNNLSKRINWIDAYHYVQSKGFRTTDGLHYDENTYNMIYNYIKSIA